MLNKDNNTLEVVFSRLETTANSMQVNGTTTPCNLWQFWLQRKDMMAAIINTNLWIQNDRPETTPSGDIMLTSSTMIYSLRLYRVTDTGVNKVARTPFHMLLPN